MIITAGHGAAVLDYCQASAVALAVALDVPRSMIDDNLDTVHHGTGRHYVIWHQITTGDQREATAFVWESRTGRWSVLDRAAWPRGTAIGPLRVVPNCSAAAFAAAAAAVLADCVRCVYCDARLTRYGGVWFQQYAGGSCCGLSFDTCHRPGPVKAAA